MKASLQVLLLSAASLTLSLPAQADHFIVPVEGQGLRAAAARQKTFRPFIKDMTDSLLKKAESPFGVLLVDKSSHQFQTVRESPSGDSHDIQTHAIYRTSNPQVEGWMLCPVSVHVTGPGSNVEMMKLFAEKDVVRVLRYQAPSGQTGGWGMYDQKNWSPITPNIPCRGNVAKPHRMMAVDRQSRQIRPVEIQGRLVVPVPVKIDLKPGSNFIEYQMGIPESGAPGTPGALWSMMGGYSAGRRVEIIYEPK